jgi:hypothetical protein
MLDFPSEDKHRPTHVLFLVQHLGFKIFPSPHKLRDSHYFGILLRSVQKLGNNWEQRYDRVGLVEGMLRGLHCL